MSREGRAGGKLCGMWGAVDCDWSGLRRLFSGPHNTDGTETVILSVSRIINGNRGLSGT